MIFQLEPMNSSVDHQNRHNDDFMSPDALMWLNDNVGKIRADVTYGSFSYSLYQQFIDQSVQQFMRGMMNNRSEKQDQIFIESEQRNCKRVRVGRIIVADGWRYKRRWQVDLKREVINMRNVRPMNNSVHELEIKDDDFAFQFRLGWL